MMNMIKNVCLFLAALFVLSSCKPHYSPEQIAYIKSIEQQRAEKDTEMKTDPGSPFKRDSSITFEPLKYFDVNPAFVFKSKLYPYATQDTVITRGTKGEERKVVRLGYVTCTYENKLFNINVYQGTSRSGETYHSIWFTDKTTGDETYGVGRYIDFTLNRNPDYVYTIDFNLAYNPYCSYSSVYSCAVPTRDDYIDVAIKAGEKKFHH